MYKYIFNILFSIIWDIYTKVELPDMFYCPFGSEQLFRQMATNLILIVHEEQNTSRKSESKNSLSLYLILFLSLRRLVLFTGGALKFKEVLFPTIHMLVTGKQTTEVLSEHHRQAIKAATSEEEFHSLCLRATQLPILATDSPPVKGHPETSELAQTLLFWSYHSLDRCH